MFWKLKPPVKAPYSKHLWKGVFHTHMHGRKHTLQGYLGMWTPEGLGPLQQLSLSRLRSPYLWLFCCVSCQISLHILSQIMTGPLSMNYRVIQDYAIMSTLFHPCQAANGWGVITGSSCNSLRYTQTHTGCDLTLLGGAAGWRSCCCNPSGCCRRSHSGQILQVWGEERLKQRDSSESRANTLFGAWI